MVMEGKRKKTLNVTQRAVRKMFTKIEHESKEKIKESLHRAIQEVVKGLNELEGNISLYMSFITKLKEIRHAINEFE